MHENATTDLIRAVEIKTDMYGSAMHELEKYLVPPGMPLTFVILATSAE